MRALRKVAEEYEFSWRELAGLKAENGDHAPEVKRGVVVARALRTSGPR
jgi:hypothetical protein